MFQNDTFFQNGTQCQSETCFRMAVRKHVSPKADAVTDDRTTFYKESQNIMEYFFGLYRVLGAQKYLLHLIHFEKNTVNTKTLPW